MKRPYLKYLGRVDGLKVYLVSGLWVRRHIDIDFTMGSNDMRADYVPSGQVWVDNDLSKDERAALIAHEVTERHRMAHGVSYNEAHRMANVVERRIRRNR